MSVSSFIATTGSGLSRATHTDSGAWQVETLLADQEVRCLAADPLEYGVVYAGTHGQGVLRSDDGGTTWRPAGLGGHIGKALAVSQAEPGVVYAGTTPPMLFVSRDGGAHWAELEAFRRVRAFWWFSPADGRPFTPYVQGIALSPTDPQLLLVGIELGAVVRSLDGGQTWQGHRKGALRDCHTLISHASQGDWFYEAGAGGAAFSCDGGKTCQHPREGFDRRYGWAVAADPARPEVWYVSASPSFASWTQPVPAAHVDGQANASIFRKIGAGRWQKLGGGLPQPLDYMAYALLTDPHAPGHLYAGLSNGEVWYSADYGDAWQKLPFSLGGIHRTMIALA